MDRTFWSKLTDRSSSHFAIGRDNDSSILESVLYIFDCNLGVFRLRNCSTIGGVYNSTLLGLNVFYPILSYLGYMYRIAARQWKIPLSRMVLKTCPYLGMTAFSGNGCVCFKDELKVLSTTMI